MDPANIWSEAAKAAAASLPANNEDWYPCGFARINIKPARGKFVKFLKDAKLGYTDDYYGGYTVSSNKLIPGYMGQSMNVKERACIAAANVLQANGINCTVMTQID